MKRRCIYGGVIVMLLVGSIGVFCGFAEASEILLSHPVLIPLQPLELKYPDHRVEEVTASRIWKPGMEILAEGQPPALLLCPDFTTISLTPGQPMSCPASADIQNANVLLLAESDEDASDDSSSYQPTLSSEPLLPIKDPLEPGTRYASVAAALESLPTVQTDAGVKSLLCAVYDQANDDNAVICYLELIEALQDPQQQRSLALTMYRLALYFWKNNRKPESVQWAQEAFSTYRKAGTYQGEFREIERGFLRLVKETREPEIQAFAHHHLALLYHFYAQQTRLHVEQARRLYEELGQQETSEQVEQLIRREQ